jgi:hypothetical protein
VLALESVVAMLLSRLGVSADGCTPESLRAETVAGLESRQRTTSYGTGDDEITDAIQDSLDNIFRMAEAMNGTPERERS